MQKKLSFKYCQHMMAAGRRFHPPLIEKAIRESRSSLVPHNKWEAVCNYIKERQPEEYQRALESMKKTEDKKDA